MTTTFTKGGSDSKAITGVIVEDTTIEETERKEEITVDYEVSFSSRKEVEKDQTLELAAFGLLVLLIVILILAIVCVIY